MDNFLTNSELVDFHAALLQFIRNLARFHIARGVSDWCRIFVDGIPSLSPSLDVFLSVLVSWCAYLCDFI